MHLNPAAHEYFASQHGVASTRQLNEVGYTDRQIRRLVDAGAIAVALRGAYRTPSTPWNELARCAAVCLARPDVAVAGPTAGRLWNLRRLPPDQRVHVIGPPASNPAIVRWVVTYHTAAFHADDVLHRSDGIRLTTRARTAFDLARQLRGDDLLSVIEQAMHDGRLTESDMWTVAADWISPARPWARAFARQLERRLIGSAAESHPEVRVALALQRANVCGLARQFQIDLPGHGRARFDLASPALQWAIEVDVHPRHEETAGRAADQRRDDAAEQIGWITTRISRAEYLTDFDGTIARLVALHRDLRRTLPATG